MKRKVAILYGSPTKLTNAHKPVAHIGGFAQPNYFVRMEVKNTNFDLSDTLRLAKPQDGETLLNTVEL